jgi:hypothetical protein
MLSEMREGEPSLTVIGSSPPDGVYGDPVPSITPSYVGFVGSDNAGL